MYNKVADSGDVLIQKQRSSIVDTHEPVIAIPLPPSYPQMASPHKSQISPIGHRQGEHRSVSFGLHHVNSVSTAVGYCIMKDTRQPFLRSVSSEPGDDTLPSASLQNSGQLVLIY